jgi:hypothetical protein
MCNYNIVGTTCKPCHLLKWKKTCPLFLFETLWWRHLVQVEGVYGSRMTGGGFGGCTVTLLKKVNKHWVCQNKLFLYLFVFNMSHFLRWNIKSKGLVVDASLYSQSHSYSTFICLHLLRPLSIFFIAYWLSWKNLPGVPSRELNSGLLYNRPPPYQLSFAAPWLSYAASFWATLLIQYYTEVGMCCNGILILRKAYQPP